MKQRSQTGWPWFRLILSAWPIWQGKSCPRWWNEMMAILSIWALQQELCLIQGQCLQGIKAFVKQFSLNLRADLAGKKIRVNNIEPGLLRRTEFSSIRFKETKKNGEALYRDAHAIQPEDIANTVAWLIQQPKHVNVNQLKSCRFPNLWPSTCLSWLKRSNHSTRDWLFFIFLWYNRRQSKEKKDGSVNYWFYSLWWWFYLDRLPSREGDAHIDHQQWSVEVVPLMSLISFIFCRNPTSLSLQSVLGCMVILFGES